MTNDLLRVAFALGFEPKEDITFEDIEDRANFLRQLAESNYRKGAFDSNDLDAACLGVAPTSVGRAVQALARAVSRHATTEPGPPPSETSP